MTVADSPRKKRRASSLLPNRRKPIIKAPVIEEKTDTMDIDKEDAGMTFERYLQLSNLVEEYDNDRNELVKKEEGDTWDRAVRPTFTSRSKKKFEMTEARAAIIIRAIREYERRVTFGNLPSEAIPGPETLDMGGQFLTNKERIDTQSKLFEIAELVPKGALLHLHFNAELNPEQLLVQAKKMENIYIRSIRPLLNDKDLDETEMVFNVLDPHSVDKTVDIFHPDYPGRSDNWKKPEMQSTIWMKWSDFQEKFEEKKFHERVGQRKVEPNSKEPLHGCGKDTGPVDLSPAENWLKSKMILSPKEAYGKKQTVNG
jgi:adenosine deaminase CECR1